MQFFVYFTMTEGKRMNPPTPEGMAEMGRFMEESFETGIIVSTGKLSQEVIQVELAEGEFSISDGPFIEGKELIPGFTVIETQSEEEAIAWGKKLRQCMGDGVLRLSQLSGTSPKDMKA